MKVKTEKKTIETIKAWIPVEIIVTDELKRKLEKYQKSIDELQERKGMILKYESIDEILEDIEIKIDKELSET